MNVWGERPILRNMEEERTGAFNSYAEDAGGTLVRAKGLI